MLQLQEILKMFRINSNAIKDKSNKKSPSIGSEIFVYVFR